MSSLLDINLLIYQKLLPSSLEEKTMQRGWIKRKERNIPSWAECLCLAPQGIAWCVIMCTVLIYAGARATFDSVRSCFPS